MEKLFVLDDVAPYACTVGSVTPGVTTIRDFAVGTLQLAEGAVGFINEAGVTLPLATGGNTVAIDALVKSSRRFAVILGTTYGVPHISSWIDRESATLEAQPYCAPVKQIQFIGNDGTNGNDLNTAISWATAVGKHLKFASVKVEEYPNIQPGATIYFDYVIQSTVVATELANFVTLINANPKTPFVASVVAGNKGIKLINKWFGTQYTITYPTELGVSSFALVDANLLATVGTITLGFSQSVPMFLGCGRPSQIKLYENLSNVHSGWADTYREASYDEQPIFSASSKVSTSPTCGYNQSVVEWTKDNHQAQYRVGKPDAQKLSLAMPLTVDAITKAVTGYGAGLTKALQDEVNATISLLLAEARTAAGTVSGGMTGGTA